MIESGIAYLLDFSKFVEENYKVNPWLFMILFFGSAAPLYYGYYRIGRSAVKIEDRKIKKKKLDVRELKIGIIIASIAWVLPYVYILFWGELPLKGWLIFAVFVVIMGFFFIHTLRAKIKKAKIAE